MALRLNEPKKYKAFEGPNNKQMPKLIEEGRIPLSVSGLMRAKLDFRGTSIQGYWWDNYFDTGDAALSHPDGKIKVVRDAQILRELNQDSKLINGALVLEDGMYESLEGPEFTREDLKKAGVERALTREEAKEHPVWQYLARDQVLLNQYTGATFDLAEEQFRHDENMGIYVSSIPDKPNAWLWCVLGLGDWSYAYARIGLDSGRGRLVG